MTTTEGPRTITVPNDEVITITRHTTVISEGPPPTSTSEVESIPETVGGAPAPTPTSSEATLSPAPEPTTSEVFPPGDVTGNAGKGGLSPGAIVGASVGGAIVIALLVIVALIIKRRLKSRRARRSAATNEMGRDDLVEEKHFPHTMSAHTTGTQGSSDPFAPFGGRADIVEEPKDPHRPPSNVFEMDATSVAPVELPTPSHDAFAAGMPPPPPSTGPSYPVAQKQWSQSAAADPRANLNALGNEEGRPKYINHWNQYRAMGPT